MSALVLTTTVLFSLTALAFDVGFGDGHDGPLVVNSQVVPNTYLVLSADVSAGDRFLPVVSTAGFAVGRLVLLHRTVSESPPDSGVQAAVDVTATGLGQWELARIVAIASLQLELEAPLEHTYPAASSQLVGVPEYTSVTIGDAGALTALPWDGYAGGIVAMLVNGPVTVNGAITANALGFRGGLRLNGMVTAAGGNDVSPPICGMKGEGATHRWGGTIGGLANVLNGGGGGCSSTEGGGGGGGSHRGRGGNGAGRLALPFSGLGGAPLQYDDEATALFGGGGGACKNYNSSAFWQGGNGGGWVFVRAKAVSGTGSISADGQEIWGGGGAGGTVTLQVQGPVSCSRISANGADSTDVGSVFDEPSGGGSGGLLSVWSQSLTCPLEALAGVRGLRTGLDVGGQPTSPFDPASVGTINSRSTGWLSPGAPIIVTPHDGDLVGDQPLVGGLSDAGTVFLQVDGLEVGSTTSANGTFSLQVPSPLSAGVHRLTAQLETGGVRGGLSSAVQVIVSGLVASDAGSPPAVDAGSSIGADSGIVVDAGFIDDAGLTPDAGFTLDAGGGVGPFDAGTFGVPPRFVSTPTSIAFCGARYRYGLTRRPEVIGDGPFTFSLAAVTGEVPTGITVDAATGELNWQPSSDDVGAHELRLTVTSNVGSASQEWDLLVECDGVRAKDVGCSCGSGGSTGALWLALIALRRSLRKN